MRVCSGMHMCWRACVISDDFDMFCMNLWRGGGEGFCYAVDHELVFLEQLKISVLSGRRRVRGCGWVTLCGRGAAPADMTAKWEKGGMMRENKCDSVLGLEEPGNMMFSFRSRASFSAGFFFFLIASLQLLLVTELIVN